MGFGERFVLTLRCKITQAEIQQSGEQLAETVEALEALQDAKSNASKAYDEEIKAKRRTRDALALDVRTGTAERCVECYEQPRWSELLVNVVRDDTGEVVRTRSMTDDERQLVLDVAEPSADESADKPKH